MKFYLKSVAVAFVLALVLLFVVHLVGASMNDFPFGWSFAGIIQGGGTSNVGAFFGIAFLFSLLAALPAVYSRDA